MMSSDPLLIMPSKVTECVFCRYSELSKHILMEISINARPREAQ